MTLYKELLWLSENRQEEIEECPRCGSTDIEFQTMGWSPPSPDPNKRTCIQCKDSWYLEEYSKLKKKEKNERTKKS